MPDFIDQIDERDERIKAAQVGAVREKANIPAGNPGVCDLCGEWSGRLVGGNCAPCRDKWKLP